MRMWAAVTYLRIRPNINLLRARQQTFGFHNGGRFLDYVRDYQLLTKDLDR
jgi:hypothetical protein